MVSKGGGGKRGRPVSLTPEQRLENERKRWRDKKTRKRKEAKDANWQRSTNFGYFVQLWVPHYNRLTESLVGAGYLHVDDADVAPRVDAAVDKVLEAIPDKHWGLWASDGTPSRRLGSGRTGTVRVRMTADLVDRLVAHGCHAHYKASHPGPGPDRKLVRECEIAEARFDECKAALMALIPGPEYVMARTEMERARAVWRRLADQVHPLERPPIDEDDLAKFAEGLQHDREFLRKTAAAVIFRWYAGYVFDLPWHPCNCKLALPECDCLSRFRPPPGEPKPAAWPRGERPLVKQSLYSGREGRWWRNPRHDDDPIIRSHDKSASVGMKGFNAGSKGAWKNNNAVYFPEQDDRASTRDWDKTAREGAKALEKRLDDPKGTPKSWSNPSDVAPDNEEVTRIGKRVIEDGVIEPYKRKKGYSEDDE